MERVPIADLECLAALFGPHSYAATVLAVIRELDSPQVWRHMRQLYIFDMVTDTMPIRRWW